uniref:C-type lectin domain-containing protein n=2 Tax=Caenorhabditis tropicalis TaxID=1561998 RepID=A0A1I7V452_9PELO
MMAIPRILLVKNGCPPGWIRSERPSGGWCIKVFAGAFIRDAADLKCREQGAVLSGLKDSAEIEKITDSARLIFSPNPINILWIGAKRIARCLRAPPSTGCNWSNAFEWTDGVTTGREGFIWNTGQPDNRGLRQGCSTLMVLMGPTIRTYNLFYNGRLDDNDCPYPVNGYVCGKHAIRN